MIVEQRCERLDSNVCQLAQRGGGSHANKCCRANLDGDAARCARSERGEGRNSKRIDPLLAINSTFSISQPHRRSLVMREDSVVRAEDIGTMRENARPSTTIKE